MHNLNLIDSMSTVKSVEYQSMRKYNGTKYAHKQF